MGSGVAGHPELCTCADCKRLKKNAYMREYDRTRRANDPEYAERERKRKREYMQRVFADDPEAVREYQRQWAEEHREHVNQRARRYQNTPESRERKAQRTRAWFKAHPDRKREFDAVYYAQNREQIRATFAAYRIRNRARINAAKKPSTWKRRALLKRAQGMFTQAEFMALCQDFENRCAYCHTQSESLTPDHLLPLARGGANTIDNIVPACLSCNASKQARTPVEFLAYHTRSLQARRKLKLL